MCHGVTGSVFHDTRVLHGHKCPRDETEITDSVVVSGGVSARLMLVQCDLGSPGQSPVRDYSLQTASTGESNSLQNLTSLTHKHIGSERTISTHNNIVHLLICHIII